MRFANASAAPARIFKNGDAAVEGRRLDQIEIGLAAEMLEHRSSRSERCRIDENMQFIDEIGRQERRAEYRAAIDQNVFAFLAFQAFDFFRSVAPDNFGVSRLRLKARFAENEFCISEIGLAKADCGSSASLATCSQCSQKPSSAIFRLNKMQSDEVVRLV